MTVLKVRGNYRETKPVVECLLFLLLVRFAVDLGPNEMNLTVRPMKGIVQARSKVSIRIELIGKEEGTFFGEFWQVVTTTL